MQTPETHMVQLPTDAPSPDAILALGRGYWASQVLLTAVELGVFTILAESGPLELEALRGRLGIHHRGARDFLDALVALGMLEREGAETYRNTPPTDLFLDRAKPHTYLGGPFEMANQRLWSHWGRLPQALRTGQPQNELRSATGSGLFPTLFGDPAKLEVFLRAMTSNSIAIAPGIAAAFPWREVNRVADLGCARGGLLVALAHAHPHLLGTGFDLTPVRPAFESYVAEAGLAERIHFHAGDFFVDPLPEAEVLIMGHVLHDWSAEECSALVRRAYEALPPGGSLLVYDPMLDEARRENVAGLLMSLNMLVNTPAGSEYTVSTCEGWMREAGFRNCRAVRLPRGYAVVAATK